MNAAVVPEKYRSASCTAHAGNHAGSSGRRLATSSVMPQDRAQIGFEDRRSFLKLIGEACEVLQLADRLFRLPHAVGGRIHLAAEEIGVLTVDGHLGQRLNLAFDAIELDGNELGVLPRAPEVVEPQLAACNAVLQRSDDAVVAAGLRGLQVLSKLGNPRGDL